MAIVDDDIERIRSTVSIVDVVSQQVQLRKTGRNWVGLCPFHAERTPSFNVREETGRYKCFGCDASGDVFTFVQEIDHVDFVGAVEQLAAKAGIQLTYTTAGHSKERARRKQLVDAMAKAVDWYHDRLLNDPGARAARDYLRSRGLAGDVARTFKIGWAPDEWDALSRGAGIAPDLLRDNGLAFSNRSGRLQDAFRARVLFPIFNENGEPVGVGGRILPGSTDPAKYKNSPETPIYTKSKTLYGLNWAKAGIVAADQAIVCEGYTDVIGFHRAGLPRARSRRAGRRSPRSTSGCSSDTRAGSCWRSTPTQPVRARPSGSTSGSRSTRSRSAWRGSQGARTRGSWPNRIRTPSPRPSARRCRSSASGSTGCSRARRRSRRSSVPVSARWRWRSSTSIRTRTCASCTPARSRPRSGCRSPISCSSPSGACAARRCTCRRPDRAAGPRENAEFVAITQLVQDWNSIAPWLVESLFADELYRRAFLAIAAASGDLGVALQEADPEAREVLERAAVVDLEVDAEAEARNLIAAAVRRELGRTASTKDPALELDDREARLRLEDLGVQEHAADAADWLLGWLAGRTEGR